MAHPTEDGEVMRFRAGASCATTPIVYYVNGIRTDGETHARTAMVISALTERQVTGVYNLTEGMVADLWECLYEWVASVESQWLEWLLSARALLPGDPVSRLQRAAQFFSGLPEPARLAFADFWLSNVASRALFHQLRARRTERQLVVAHSQGNLVTCDALWGMVLVYGQQSLHDVRVYSLASPVPAWPAGIDHRRQEFGHVNDVVTLLRPQNLWSYTADSARHDPLSSPAATMVLITDELTRHRFGRSAGDWRTHGTGSIGIAAHDVELNIYGTRFANAIRRDVGLPPLPSHCGAPGCPGHSDPSHRCAGGP